MSSSSKLAQTLGATPGTVYVVGNGEVYGEVGMDDVREITHPITISELEYEPIIKIVSSSLHTLALNKQGKIWSWGCNEFGALGRTGTESSPRPINHPSVKYIKFNKVACGCSISMAISSKGQLYTWGTFQSSHGVYGYLPNTEIQPYPRIDNALAKINIIDIAAGASHCLALSDEGKVYSWGCGDFSQLGRGEMNKGDKNSLIPVALELEDIVSIACGSYHSFAVNRYGQLYAWGMNHFQQCGLVEKVSETEELMSGEIIYEPTLVPYFKVPHLSGSHEFKNKQYDPLKRKRIIQVDIIQDDDDDDDEVGKPTGTVTEKNEDTIITDINLSAMETLTLEKTTDIYLNAPQNNLGSRIKCVSAGEHHSIVLMEDNRLIEFGRCDGGQLGVMLYKNYRYMGALTSKELDNQVYAIGYPMENLWHCEQEIKKIICGNNHNLILTQDGTAYGFGHSGHFQLGLYDAQEEVRLPTKINSVSNVGRVVEASAGDRFSMFVIA